MFQKIKELFFKPIQIDVEKREFVSVRMEAIGGQGAHSAGKILAEAAVLGHQYSGQHFSSFGSEKRGSHVRSFVRFSVQQKPLRAATAVKNPDVLVVFHAKLLETHPEIISDVTDKTWVLINASNPSEIQWPENISTEKLILLPATEMARVQQVGLNIVMLGLVQLVLPEIQSEILIKSLNQFFVKNSPEQSVKNKTAFLKVNNKIQQVTPEKLGRQSDSVEESSRWGWLNAPIGGVILNPGNTLYKDLSASRKGVAPKLISEICFHCGFCDMVCPDFCFVWQIDPKNVEKPILQGIDYQYCKGCQKCVTVCPVNALVPVPEAEISEEERKFKIAKNKHALSDSGIYSENHSSIHYAEDHDESMRTPLDELLNTKSHVSDILLKSEDWKNYLTPEMIQQIEERKKK